MLIIFCIIIIILLIIILLGGFILFEAVFDREFNLPQTKQSQNENPLLAPTGEELHKYNDKKKIEYRKLSFETLTIKSFDGLTLYGNLLKGKKDTKETVICVHGYKSSPEGDFCGIIEIYLKRGCNILLVEDRAHGRSGGRYIGFGELDRYDVLSWVDKINELFPNNKVYLHGVSMGAASVLHTANMNLSKNVKGIIADCGFTSIREVTKNLMPTIYGLPYFPLGYIAELYSIIIAKISFTKSNSVECVSNTNIPIVIISGKEDCYVPYEMTKRIYDACVSKKYLLSVDDTGHSASYMMKTDEYTDLVNYFMDET